MKRIIKRERLFDTLKYVPQYRSWFWLLFFVPIPIWKDFKYEFGDDYYLGLLPTSYEFDTKSEAEKFLDDYVHE